MNLIERAKKYSNGITILKEWIGDGGIPAPIETAQARADICLTCDQNRGGGILSEPVAKAIKAHVGLKNKLELRVNGEKGLKQCQICLCQLRLAVHVPIEHIRRHMTTEEFSNAPAWCWKITEKI